ncbi:MAG: hypothetical protein HY054_11825 [Proteobacteria bacterium]|nr:hypothetical protein [Pseudomonadota bacterium]
MNKTFALSLVAIGFSAITTGAMAQSQGAAVPAGTASSQEAPWVGLPFTSLADYESKIPIGMSHDDVVQRLGQPEQIMPGQEQDQVYLYGYRLQDGRDLTAVVVLRGNSVFIRRLYITTPAAGPAAH